MHNQRSPGHNQWQRQCPPQTVSRGANCGRWARASVLPRLCLAVWLCGAVAGGLDSSDAGRADSTVVTILEPYAGAVLRESNDPEITFAAETGRREWRAGAEPAAVVTVRVDDRMQEIRLALPELRDQGGACEKTFRMTGLPNGLYHVSVQIDFGEGASIVGAGAGAATSTFTIDVGVELEMVLDSEDEDAEGAEEEGGQGRDKIMEERRKNAGEAWESFSDADLEARAGCASLGLSARRRPARIYDGFTYKDEIDLLEVRGGVGRPCVAADIYSSSYMQQQSYVTAVICGSRMRQS